MIRVHKGFKTVHHLTITAESGNRAGQYLTHVILEAGTGVAQAEAIYKVLQEYNSTDTLIAVCCDNTATNTGHKSGVVVELEKKLNRKLHKIGCLLHWNELPLRQVIRVLDGDTVSGSKWSGPICSRLNEDHHQQESVNFKTVSSPLQRPDDDIVNSLSRDQRLLLENVIAVSSGTWSSGSFKYAKVGPPNSARWLTLAIRILVLYTRTAEPTEELCRIVDFIVKVYAPGWFNIKKHNNFLDGPRILFEILEDARALNDQQCLAIVIDKLQCWAFSLQAENFIASVLFSTTSSRLEKMVAALRVLDIREEPIPTPTSKAITPLNKEARKWTQLIQLSEAKHEPPLTCTLDPPQLEALAELSGGCFCPHFPLHTQTVERSVKATTEASTTSWSWEKRHGSIIVRSESRAKREQLYFL